MAWYGLKEAMSFTQLQIIHGIPYSCTNYFDIDNSVHVLCTYAISFKNRYQMSLNLNKIYLLAISVYFPYLLTNSYDIGYVDIVHPYTYGQTP